MSITCIFNNVDNTMSKELPKVWLFDKYLKSSSIRNTYENILLVSPKQLAYLSKQRLCVY